MLRAVDRNTIFSTTDGAVEHRSGKRTGSWRAGARFKTPGEYWRWRFHGFHRLWDAGTRPWLDLPARHRLWKLSEQRTRPGIWSCRVLSLVLEGKLLSCSLEIKSRRFPFCLNPRPESRAECLEWRISMVFYSWPKKRAVAVSARD